MKLLNRKGFTLVELLATIVILGVISAIAMVSIDGMLDEAAKTECENILLSIKSATKNYVSDKRFNLSSKKVEIAVSKLVSDGYLSDEITNPFNKKYSVNEQKIKLLVTLNDDYTYNDVDIYVRASYSGIDVSALLVCDAEDGSVKKYSDDGGVRYEIRFPG